jgi:hypothetical protein
MEERVACEVVLTPAALADVAAVERDTEVEVTLAGWEGEEASGVEAANTEADGGTSAAFELLRDVLPSSPVYK